MENLHIIIIAPVNDKNMTMIKQATWHFPWDLKGDCQVSGIPSFILDCGDGGLMCQSLHAVERLGRLVGCELVRLWNSIVGYNFKFKISLQKPVEPRFHWHLNISLANSFSSSLHSFAGTILNGKDRRLYSAVSNERTYLNSYTYQNFLMNK